MPYSDNTLWALMAYTVVMIVTPEPNNLLLLTSGLNFGLRRTVWLMAGILSGVLLQICITGGWVRCSPSRLSFKPCPNRWAAYICPGLRDGSGSRICRMRPLRSGPSGTARR